MIHVKQLRWPSTTNWNIIVHEWTKEFHNNLPRGGGFPVTPVNLDDITFLSEATTPSNCPKSCPSRPINDHKSLSHSQLTLPMVTPYLASIPVMKVNNSNKWLEAETKNPKEQSWSCRANLARSKVLYILNSCLELQRT